MGFVSFFAACKSYVSPSFILMVPVDVRCYYLYGGTARTGRRMSGLAESANRRAGAVHNACTVDGMQVVIV